jgi:signal transduction histidine kinase/ActR/RegA family two-component response regulator
MADTPRVLRNAALIQPAHVAGRTGDSAFSALFETSGEALLIINTEGVIQRVNGRARGLLRMGDARSRQRDLTDFLSQSKGGQLAFLSNAGGRGYAHSVDVSLPTGEPVRVILRSILPDSLHLLLCVEENLSGDQTAEAGASQLDSELRCLLDSVQTGVLLFDLAGLLRFSNPRFGELFGLDGPGLKETKNMDELAAAVSGRCQSPEVLPASWKLFAAGHLEPLREELKMAGPLLRVLERSARPVLDSVRQPIGWLEIYADVTEYQLIQSKMLQTEKMAALGQIVSGIAHELNSPLTAIMGYSQLLLGHGLVPSHLAEVRNVYQEAERARRIVKNLLYFARENKPERSAVDLNEIVERTLALRGYELKVQNILVQCDLDPDLPQTMADPYQLQQVILNLVMNAEQAFPKERRQGRVVLRTRHLRQDTGSRILLEVSDDGPGIPPEIAPRIFDPFFTTKPPGVGTGLGLSIVYGIVRQHEGDVTFESAAGSGAKFLVDLPVIPIAAVQRDSRTISPSPPSPIARGRILVIEDEPIIAQLIVDILQEEGHHAEAVLDSQDGLARLSRGLYNLMICDLRMPGMDGRALYETLVRTGSPIQDKIIFVTGDTLAPGILEFLEPNHLQYLSKPFLVEELKLAVNQQLAASNKSAKGLTKGPRNAGK